MTEDSSFHWRTKPRHLSSETSGRAGLEFVCIFGHDELGVSLFIRPVCQTPAQFDSTFKRPLERCKLLTRWAFEYFDQTGIDVPKSVERTHRKRRGPNERYDDRCGSCKERLRDCHLARSGEGCPSNSV